MESGSSITGNMIESSCYLVNYVGDVVSSLCPPTNGRASSPPWDGEALPPSDIDNDWVDELGHEEDEESGGDDSVSSSSHGL